MGQPMSDCPIYVLPHGLFVLEQLLPDHLAEVDLGILVRCSFCWHAMVIEMDTRPRFGNFGYLHNILLCPSWVVGTWTVANFYFLRNPYFYYKRLHRGCQYLYLLCFQ